jgi:hypothetical protein
VASCRTFTSPRIMIVGPGEKRPSVLHDRARPPLLGGVRATAIRPYSVIIGDEDSGAGVSAGRCQWGGRPRSARQDLELPPFRASRSADSAVPPRAFRSRCRSCRGSYSGSNPLHEAPPVFRRCLTSPGSEVENSATTALGLVAPEISDDVGTSLESAARDNPDDLDIRIALLGYYAGRQLGSDPMRDARRSHVLAVVENWPTSSIAGSPWAALDDIRRESDFALGRAAWLRQIEAKPDDRRVLNYAASFMTINDKTKADRRQKTEVTRQKSQDRTQETRWAGDGNRVTGDVAAGLLGAAATWNCIHAEHCAGIRNTPL